METKNLYISTRQNMNNIFTNSDNVIILGIFHNYNDAEKCTLNDMSKIMERILEKNKDIFGDFRYTQLKGILSTIYSKSLKTHERDFINLYREINWGKPRYHGWQVHEVKMEDIK
jgi:hypothetical protein